ncbi:MAG: hypothetical protein JNM70_03355 [Anaerolineae bacterium]|nr:hypothetical protein [Anaerolineae bacterium]
MNSAPEQSPDNWVNPDPGGLRVPLGGAALRWAALLYGGSVLLWLNLEDTRVWPVALLSWSGALLLAAGMTTRHLGGASLSRGRALLGGMLVGAGVGLGSSLICAGLMFFKNALHAHLFLDYPVLMLLAMIQRGPGWVAAGALLGLSAALLWMARRG